MVPLFENGRCSDHSFEISTDAARSTFIRLVYRASNAVEFYRPLGTDRIEPTIGDEIAPAVKIGYKGRPNC